MAEMATVTFAPERFVWTAGGLELTGRWAGADVAALGPVRLVVEVDGRPHSIGAEGWRAAAKGERWRARFTCSQPPDDGAGAILEAGELEFELPAPRVGQLQEPREAESGLVDLHAQALLDQLGRERAALDDARHRLERERRAAEETEARLAGARRSVERAGSPYPAREPEDDPYAFVVAGIIAFLFLIVLLWVLL